MSIADSRAEAHTNAVAALRIPAPRTATDIAAVPATPANLFITDHEGRSNDPAGLTRLRLGFLELPAIAAGIAASFALGAPELLVCAAVWFVVQFFGAATDIRRHQAYAIAPVLRRAAIASWPMLLIAAVAGADRAEVIACALALPVLSAAGRLVVGRFVNTRVQHRVLLVGTPEIGSDFPLISDSQHEFAGLLSVADPDKADVLRAAVQAGADKVLLMPGTLANQQVRNLGWELEKHDIALVLHLGLMGVDSSRLDAGIDPLGVTVLPSSASTPMRTFREALDRVAASLLVLVASPLLILVALAVRLDSAGPAIFTQVRIGRDGREFRIFKFRSMHIDAEERLAELREHADGGNEVLFKMARDPRITRLGRLIRATSLDELPQLFNVVRGDMALIGPRPALPIEVAAYDEVARRRLAVKPGITGLWQVSGRSDLTFDQSIALDVDYVDNWNIGLDAYIAMRTVKAVVTREGAY